MLQKTKTLVTKQVFVSLFFLDILTENRRKMPEKWQSRQKSRKNRSWAWPFQEKVEFGSILGPQMGAKNHEKCVRKRVRKNAPKKSLTWTKMRRVGVMCWASGEVRRGHTSYDSLRTGSRSESSSVQSV